MIEIVEQEYENVEEYKNEIINSFAEVRGQPFGWGQFAYEAVDNGERVGVVMGYWLYDWLYVEYLAVTETFRGEGVGSRLLERAETLAHELSLEGVALDTFGYQAPPYYEARGYTERMVIPGRDRQRDRIYFQKKFEED
jgi:GNAT superfamily N-acetyltransferase